MTGFIVSMALRFISSVINFVMFYSRSLAAKGSLNFLLNLKEALWYCFGYVGVETLLSVILLLIPGINHSIEYCKYVANNDYPFNKQNI